MPEAAVGADLHESLDVLGVLAAQVALDGYVLVDALAKLQDLVVGEVLDGGVGAHPGRLQDHVGLLAAHSVDSRKPDLDPLVEWNVESGAAHQSRLACD